MAWSVLARSLFIAAVGYSAFQLHPLAAGGLSNIEFGILLGLLIVVFEMRLRNTSVTHLLGALLGGAIGLLTAKTLGAAMYWANLSDGQIGRAHV